MVKIPFQNIALSSALVVLGLPLRAAEDLGAMWGTAEEEANYYPLVDIPIPPGVPMRPGSFEILPDGRLAVGTRRGDVYFISGAFDSPPKPVYHLFASGQDEIFGLAWKDSPSPSRSSVKSRSCPIPMETEPRIDLIP
jgi:hypothetical protein